MIRAAGLGVAMGNAQEAVKAAADIFMPVEGEVWMCDPFAAEVIPLPGLGLSLVARGAENSKGSLASFLNAASSWQHVHGRLPVNLKFILEGEEELGSPSLPGFVERYQERLRADAAIYPSLCQDRTGKPVMKLGFKGIAFFHLKVKGGGLGRPIRTCRSQQSRRLV